MKHTTLFQNVPLGLETKVGKRMKRKKNERGKEGRVKLLQNQVRSCNVIQVLEILIGTKKIRNQRVIKTKEQ